MKSMEQDAMQFMAERVAQGADANTVLAELADRYKTVPVKKRSNILQSAVRQVMQQAQAQQQKTDKQFVTQHIKALNEKDGTNSVKNG